MRNLVDKPHRLDVRPVVDGRVDFRWVVIGSMDVKLAPGIFNIPRVVVANVVNGSESTLGPVHGGHVGDTEITLLAIVVVRSDAEMGERRKGGSEGERVTGGWKSRVYKGRERGLNEIGCSC